MASSSGTSSGSIQIQNSGSEEDLQALIMNQRKQKRMLSNRESARRSRQRKQKHLDELTAQVEQLKKENNQIMHALNVTTRGYFAIEAENSVLRTQHLELSNRLHSLTEIALLLNGNGGARAEEGLVAGEGNNCEGLVKPWSMVMVPSESMAMYQYC